MSTDDRTEKPSSKRVRDAREKGQVARSDDVISVAAFAASLFVLNRWGGRLVSDLAGELKRALSQLGDAPLKTLIFSDVSGMAVQSGMVLATTVGPIAVAAMLATIAASMVQTGGLLISFEPLAINLGKLSPGSGLKRFWSMGAYELVKMVVLTIALSWLAYRAIESVLVDVPRLARAPTGVVVVTGWGATDRVLRQSLIVLAVVAAADYAMERWRLMNSLKMTKQEVKDEMRQAEGSPEVKMRVRKIQRDMFRRRMLTATKQATVVITNPTHVAVALEYRRSTMAAPRVVAKGQDLLALKIREIAREAGVPIVEEVALARALYKSAEVGETIPADLFEAVAEVLVYLIKLKQLVLQN
jgi:flagellar biosynthetic protein FlhB